MNVIGSGTPHRETQAGALSASPLSPTPQQGPNALGAAFAWATMYGERPSTPMTLIELERLIAKRMDLLAFVDQQLNSPKASNLNEIYAQIETRIRSERQRFQNNTPSVAKSSVDLFDDDHEGAAPGTTAAFGGVTGDAAEHFINEEKRIQQGSVVAVDSGMTREEDLISHHLSRFAFCMDEKWRSWFVRTEEALLKARIRTLGMSGVPQAMLALNRVAARPLTAEEANDPFVIAFIQMVSARNQARTGGSPQGTSISARRFFAVPMSLVPKLVKDRKVLCVKGTAIISEEHALDLVVTIYKRSLIRGLYEAFLLRSRLQGSDDEEHPNLLWTMADAFLLRFVADPTDSLAEVAEGSVRPQNVAIEASTHMPLCMRRIDAHLRAEGHLKHHGRFMYGLFLKQIGLSLEDALVLFSSLMTVKGGGSVEVFEKSSYGYNIRHKYGKEGKKTSYTSMGCASVIKMPPMVDRHDCHGCPFRFRDESNLRRLLNQEQPNPLGKGFPSIKPTQGDIEDIVKDAKGEHYTRACYKYFMATHPEAHRDSLFRSPFEYHSCSKQQKKDYEASAASRAAAATVQDPDDVNSAPAVGHVSGVKRPGGTTLLRPATKARTEQSPQ